MPVLYFERGTAGQPELQPPPHAHAWATCSYLLSESIFLCPGDGERSGSAGFVSSSEMAEEVGLGGRGGRAEE